MKTKAKKGAVWEIMERQGSFTFAFLAVFTLSVLFLAAMDVLPDPIKVAPTNNATDVPNPTTQTHTPPTKTTTDPAAPTRVVIPNISVDATVSNPTSTNIETLDQALLKGAVRYPTSAVLGVDGTVLLFAHSSYLPIVHNQAYKTFDGIQNLKPGEIISVYSGAKEYRYSVTAVRMANANDDVIELPQSGRHLTLVTCNSFASKSNRFVVTADLVAQ